MLRPHVVILGAGFGGVYIAKLLAPQVKDGLIDVTVVNRTNYFLFTPLLHEVATGSLSPASVAEPLREVFAGTDIAICRGNIESINVRDRRVTVSGATIDYDYLVVATGAESNYYGIPGADKFSFPLKDLADATRIRERVINSFEQAIFERDPEARARQLSFVVVGGGATGVEMAAELAEFVQGISKRYYQKTNHCHPEEPKISLVHGGHELLEQFATSLRSVALDRLVKSGVMVHTGVTVTQVNQHSLSLSNNTTLATSTVIWSAGVKAIVPRFQDISPSFVSGRLEVDEFFAVKGLERIFAIGDVAAYIDEKLPGKPLPMLAQVASHQAQIVAGNILASINPQNATSGKPKLIQGANFDY